MAGKSGFRSYPSHLSRRGRGVVECSASGFLRHPGDVRDDVRQGTVARRFADTTPGFGTQHPQDVVQLGGLDDPSPIERGSPPDEQHRSKQDRGISDAEIKASIREGRPPRDGY